MDPTVQSELVTLLRGEIAAAQTYQQARHRVPPPEEPPLRAIQLDHGDAIRFLYRRLTAHGASAPKSAGAWGLLARTVEGAATLLGDRTALATLRRGEKTGLAQYEHALAATRLPPDCSNYVVHTLIPAQRRHIDVLSRMIDRL